MLCFILMLLLFGNLKHLIQQRFILYYQLNQGFFNISILSSFLNILSSLVIITIFIADNRKN